MTFNPQWIMLYPFFMLMFACLHILRKRHNFYLLKGPSTYLGNFGVNYCLLALSSIGLTYYCGRRKSRFFVHNSSAKGRSLCLNTIWCFFLSLSWIKNNFECEIKLYYPIVNCKRFKNNLFRIKHKFIIARKMYILFTSNVELNLRTEIA